MKNKETHPLVSVCVQTYNQENYITECLEGIMMQKTSFDFEVLVGEDESSDGTRAICQAFAKKYPDKIKLFLNKREDVIFIKGNATGRFNYMQNLNKSKGKYIAMCEGDDYWTDPNKLQKQVDFLEKNEDFAICFHSVKVFNQESKTLETDTITRKISQVTSHNELAAGNYIHTPSVMLRNDFVIPKWFELPPIGDWSLYMLSLKGRKIMKLTDVMAVYRVHGSSIWSNKSQEYKNRNTALSVKIILENLELPVSIRLILKSRINTEPKKVIKPSFITRVKRKLKSFCK